MTAITTYDDDRIDHTLAAIRYQDLSPSRDLESLNLRRQFLVDSGLTFGTPAPKTQPVSEWACIQWVIGERKRRRCVGGTAAGHCLFCQQWREALLDHNLIDHPMAWTFPDGTNALTLEPYIDMPRLDRAISDFDELARQYDIRVMATAASPWNGSRNLEVQATRLILLVGPQYIADDE